MNMSVKFNGVELGNYIDVLQGFTAFGGPDWAPVVSNRGDISKGADFQYTTYKEKEIYMPFTMLDGLENKCDELQRVLNVREPKPLIFETMPTKVFYAIPSGNLDFDEIECFGEGTITWLVPDGKAHSIVEFEFPAKVNSSGILEATIVNNGTESVPVTYDIEHTSENGFIGIVSEHGAIELGNIKEVDGTNIQMSQTLMHYKNAAGYNAMTTGQGLFFDNSYSKNGTFKETVYEGLSYLDIASPGTGSGWHGAAKTITVPADKNGEVGAKNFDLKAKVWFRPTEISQLGMIEYAIADENGDNLMSVRIAKWEPTREMAYLILCVGGKEMQRVEFNPFFSPLMVHDSGEFYMLKSEDKFVFQFGGLHTFRRPELADRKAKTVSVFIGQRDNYALVERMRLQYLIFRKDNVSDWADVPNRYAAGSKVHIDGNSAKVYVNGNEMAGDIVKGSDFFHVPPGETRVQFYFSDFCATLPEVTAKIKEAYL